jgi:hypothetical protein
MKTLPRLVLRVAAGLAALGLVASVPAATFAALDGSKPMLCAISMILECDASGECHKHPALQSPDFPTFIRISLTDKRITDASGGGKSAEIKSSSRLDGRLIIQGGENGRGWSATIAEATGRMSAGVVADEYTFALFGACTAP